MAVIGVGVGLRQSVRKSRPRSPAAVIVVEDRKWARPPVTRNEVSAAPVMGPGSAFPLGVSAEISPDPHSVTPPLASRWCGLWGCDGWGLVTGSETRTAPCVFLSRYVLCTLIRQ